MAESVFFFFFVAKTIDLEEERIIGLAVALMRMRMRKNNMNERASKGTARVSFIWRPGSRTRHVRYREGDVCVMRAEPSYQLLHTLFA